MVKIIGKKPTLGHIVCFDLDRLNKEYTKKELKYFFNQVERIKSEEFKHYEFLYLNLNQTYYDTNIMLRDLFSFFDIPILTQAFHQFFIEERLNMLKSYDNAFSIALKKSKKTFINIYEDQKFSQKEVIKELKNRIMLRIEMMLYEHMIAKIDYDFIMYAEKFKKEYFHNLPSTVQGFIFRECKDKKLAQTFASEFELPIVIGRYQIRHGHQYIINCAKNQLLYHPTEDDIKRYNFNQYSHMVDEKFSEKLKESGINIYTPLVDTRHTKKLEESNFVKGLCSFKSEFMFVTRGYIPTIEEQETIYLDVLNNSKEKEIYIRIPDFRPEKPVDYLGNSYTDIDTYKKYASIYQDNMIALAKAVRETDKEVHILIPMIRVHTEVAFWRNIVEICFGVHSAKLPQIGIMIETESAFQYIEEYQDMDFVMFGLNDLIEELSDDKNRYSNLSKNQFIELFWPDLRDAHQHLRRYSVNMKHIIGGNCLKNPEIFSKLLVSGFKDFSIRLNDIDSIKKTLYAYLNNKGRYVGLAAHRKERQEINKINKKELELQKIEQEKNRINELNAKKQEKSQTQIDSNKEKREKVVNEILAKRKTPKEE